MQKNITFLFLHTNITVRRSNHTFNSSNTGVTNAAGGTLEIYTLNRMKIMQQDIENNENHIDIHSLQIQPGIVRTDASGKSIRMKIFKKEKI